MIRMFSLVAHLPFVQWAILVGISFYPIASLAAQDEQIWTTLNLNKNLDDKNRATLELQGRFTDHASKLGQRFIRPSITHQVDDVYSFTLGYAYVLTKLVDAEDFEDSTRLQHENRPWQQVAYRLYHSKDGLLLHARTRMEERFVEGGGGIGMRLRQQFRAEIPLAADDDTEILAWNETFYGLNRTDWGQRSGFYQMRNFVGLTFVPMEKTSMDVGYLNQAIFLESDDRINHAISFTFNINL